MAELSLINNSEATVSRKDRARMLTEEIRADVQQSFENFYHVGMKLKQVEWQFLGYKSFKEYLHEELEVTEQHAYQLIRAAELRPKLPGLNPGLAGTKNGWTERTMRELLRLETQKDQVRVAGKVCKHLEENPNEKLTAKLVKKFVDVWKGPKPPKRKRAIKGEGNVHVILMRWVYQMEDWCDDLKDIPKEGWSLLREEHSEEVKRFTAVCDSLANFAREVNSNEKRS